MRLRHSMVVTLALVLAAGLAWPGAVSALQICSVLESSTKEVLPGVTVTWSSAFLCANAPDADTYQLTVTVTNAGGSTEAVVVNSLVLTHTTPRPLGQAPIATGAASGLPITVNPGESKTFMISGTYTLVQTNEGKKANLHFRASGQGGSSGSPFNLGINAHFRAPGVAL